MKVVFTGDESSGKSLRLAHELRRVVNRNARWRSLGLPPRPILCNMPLNPSFVSWAADLGVSIEPWRDLRDVIYRTECDVFMDEILKYLDAQLWANMTLDTKHWLSQGAKSGVHLYASCQDFSQVAKSARVIINECYIVTKLLGSRRPMKTAPPVKRIWGLCMMRPVDPKSFTGDNVTMESTGWPLFFGIHRDECEIFDTNAKISPGQLPPFRHTVRFCEHYGHATEPCSYCKTIHE